MSREEETPPPRLPIAPGCWGPPRRRRHECRRSTHECVAGVRAPRGFTSAPGGHDLLDSLGYFGPGALAIHAGGQQFVVIGVPVADGGGYGEGQSFAGQLSACGGSADSAAASRGGAGCDFGGFAGRAAGEEAEDFFRHSDHEFAVFLMAAFFA